MTEKPQLQSNEKITKLMTDRPSDFRFHAAFLAYSETWEKTTSEKTKIELNKIMSSLSTGEISYPEFYEKLDRIRRPDSKHYAFSRERIETQRKKDWRKRRTKNIRNNRHR